MIDLTSLACFTTAARTLNFRAAAARMALSPAAFSERLARLEGELGVTLFLQGDLEGALSVIANVPKTVVMALLDMLLRRYDFEGIRMTLQTTAGPELAASEAVEDDVRVAREALRPARRVDFPHQQVPVLYLSAHCRRFGSLRISTSGYSRSRTRASAPAVRP